MLDSNTSINECKIYQCQMFGICVDKTFIQMLYWLFQIFLLTDQFETKFRNVLISGTMKEKYAHQKKSTIFRYIPSVDMQPKTVRPGQRVKRKESRVRKPKLQNALQRGRMGGNRAILRNLVRTAL